MSGYPLGGIEIQNVDFGSVELFGVEYSDSEVYTPTGNNVLAPAGQILARVRFDRRSV